MGLMLFNDENHRYEGFSNGMHIFKDLNNDAITMTREAKLHLGNTPVTLICKSGGEVEPTYQTKRKLDAREIINIISSHGLSLSKE